MVEKRVLIVDDEPLVRTGLGRGIRKRGAAVTCVASGEAALEAIREIPYDLCFLDVRLPGMDGRAVLEHVRRISPGTRVAVMTGSHLTREEKAGVARAADYFLSKPFDFGEVESILKEMLAGW